MKTCTPEELKSVLSKHASYLRREAGGERADLGGANLERAYLGGANLGGANLGGANLRGAYLGGADLGGADLRGANLYGADLRGANLEGADLRGADLRGANLRGVDLGGANLYGADLGGANLRYAKYEQKITSRGVFTAWKKLIGAAGAGVTVELEVRGPRVEPVMTSKWRKCRASRARVVSMSGGEIAYSKHDPKFAYRVGEEVEVDDYDGDPAVQYTRGIHFFLTKEEAEAYDWT